MYAFTFSQTNFPFAEVQSLFSLKKISTENQLHSKWSQIASLFNLYGGAHVGALFVWDACRGAFVFVNNKALPLTGYAPLAYTGQEGIQLYYHNIHQTHKRGVCKILQRLSEFRKGLTKMNVDLKGYSASFDFMFQRSDGKYYRNLQCCIEVETHKTGDPAIVFSTHFDISHLRKSFKQTLIIRTPKQVHIFHYTDEQNLVQMKSISKTEIMVLNSLAQGNSSKEIANQLNISSHTVDTHRRNLLCKLNCIDTTALVTFARMVGVI